MFLFAEDILLTAGTHNTFVDWYQTALWKHDHVFGGYNSWQSYYIKPHRLKKTQTYYKLNKKLHMSLFKVNMKTCLKPNWVTVTDRREKCK